MALIARKHIIPDVSFRWAWGVGQGEAVGSPRFFRTATSATTHHASPLGLLLFAAAAAAALVDASASLPAAACTLVGPCGLAYLPTCPLLLPRRQSFDTSASLCCAAAAATTTSVDAPAPSGCAAACALVAPCGLPIGLPTCPLLLPRRQSFDTSASPCCAAAAAATTMSVDAPAPPGCAAASKRYRCLASTPALVPLSSCPAHLAHPQNLFVQTPPALVAVPRGCTRGIRMGKLTFAKRAVRLAGACYGAQPPTGASVACAWVVVPGGHAWHAGSVAVSCCSCRAGVV